MNIQLSGIVIIVGNYGSGKTEVSINLAVHLKNSGMAVRMADLDLVNFYFRTREARKYLADLGIDLVLPPEKYLDADLPILAPAVAGLIRQPAEVTLLDVGGDDAGATVLAALKDAFGDTPYRMLQVINPCRPYTQTIAGCKKIKREIEAASKMTVDGLIGNANLIDETDLDTIYSGYDFVSDVAAELALPLEFVTVADYLMPRIDSKRIQCPLLTINRQLSPPWVTKGAVRRPGTPGGVVLP